MKAASILAIALVLVIATMPTAAACCVAKGGSRMAGMQASMPCCGNHCHLVKSTTTNDNGATLTPATSLDKPLSAAVAAIAPAASAASFEVITHQASNAFSPPPHFLSQHQFRI